MCHHAMIDQLPLPSSHGCSQRFVINSEVLVPHSDEGSELDFLFLAFVVLIVQWTGETRIKRFESNLVNPQTHGA